MHPARSFRAAHQKEDSLEAAHAACNLGRIPGHSHWPSKHRIDEKLSGDSTFQLGSQGCHPLVHPKVNALQRLLRRFGAAALNRLVGLVQAHLCILALQAVHGLATESQVPTQHRPFQSELWSKAPFSNPKVASCHCRVGAAPPGGGGAAAATRGSAQASNFSNVKGAPGKEPWGPEAVTSVASFVEAAVDTCLTLGVVEGRSRQ